MESLAARAAEAADVQSESFSRNVKRGKSAERTFSRPDFSVYEWTRRPCSVVSPSEERVWAGAEEANAPARKSAVKRPERQCEAI
jgi:hypothetical protein